MNTEELFLSPHVGKHEFAIDVLADLFVRVRLIDQKISSIPNCQPFTDSVQRMGIAVILKGLGYVPSNRDWFLDYEEGDGGDLILSVPSASQSYRWDEERGIWTERG